MAKNEVHGDYDHWSMVIVYDPKTGNILHSHQVVTTRGGTHPDQATLEKLAADHASRARNTSADGLAFLHVDPQEFDFDARYSVDVKNRSLVKVVPTGAKA